MKKLKLTDPNQTKLNPMWLSAVTAALSDKYGVTVMEGEYWAMDIVNKVMTYNDSILSLSKEDALALILHETGHLANSCLADDKTHVFKECPESSMSAINTLEDFRIDFIMSHEYANSNEIIEKFNEHATMLAVDKLSQLQMMQQDYDARAGTVLNAINQNEKHLKDMGTPHKEMDDTEKFMEVVNRVGYRPRFKRPVDEVFMLCTLLYHTAAWDTPERKWGKVLADYKNKEALELAKKIVPIFKYRVEHMESTLEVQDLWESEIYPLLKEMIDKDQKQPQHNADQPMGGGNRKSEQMGGKESKDNVPDGPLNGKVKVDKQGNVSVKGQPMRKGIDQETAAEISGGGMQGPGVTKGAMDQQSRGYTKKMEGTKRVVDWNMYKEQIKGYISTAKTQMNRSLKENEYNRYAGRHGSGKLNIKRLYKFPMRDFKLFQRKGEIKGKDYAFSILIDLSGSMSGKMLEESMKGLVLMAETLNRLEQPVEITFFSSRFKNPKKFDTVIDPVELGYQASQVIGGGTDIIRPFEENLQSLLKQPTKEKIMITLTDGEFSDAEKRKIKAYQDQHKNVLHYGVGIDVKLSDIFPGERAINVKDAAQIMPAFTRILKTHIKKNK